MTNNKKFTPLSEKEIKNALDDSNIQYVSGSTTIKLTPTKKEDGESWVSDWDKPIKVKVKVGKFEVASPVHEFYGAVHQLLSDEMNQKILKTKFQEWAKEQQAKLTTLTAEL